MTLNEIDAAIKSCVACDLASTRTKTVTGKGNPNAELMLIGEAPGANEDKTGVPFVGAAGKKLDALLERCGIDTDNVYIANVLKCRPPRNADPKPEQVACCRKFLDAQIEAVQPKVIVCLGLFASRYMLRRDDSMATMHGQVVLDKDNNRLIIATYHPAAAIYKPDTLHDIESDLRKAQACLVGFDQLCPTE